MPLTGIAKTNYQRNYMRKKRLTEKTGLTQRSNTKPVRPPQVDADGNAIPEY